jgi:hypothetical protein
LHRSFITFYCRPHVWSVCRLRSNRRVLLFFAALSPEARSSHTSEAHINPHDAHIIRMNIGGAVPLRQGDKDASGASSDEESVTGGGALLRAVEFCRCQQIYVDSGNDKGHCSCSVLVCVSSTTVKRLRFHLITNRGRGFQRVRFDRRTLIL